MDIKSIWEAQKDRIVLFLEFSLIALIFFGLGMLFQQRTAGQQPIVITTEATSVSGTAASNDATVPLGAALMPPLRAPSAGSYVASKNGKTYYLTSCSNRIKEGNKVYFTTQEDAQKAGFTPAKTCFK